MKKYFTLIAALALMLGICAVLPSCNNEAAQDTESPSQTIYYIDEETGLVFILNEDGKSYTVCSQQRWDVIHKIRTQNHSTEQAKAWYNEYKSAVASITEINIPAQYNGLPVTTISNGAFEGCTGLTSVTIPDSVTRIEYDTFYGCTGLTSVTLPEGVTNILGSFHNCPNLTSVTIPKSMTYIPMAFQSCTNLKEISYLGTAEEWAAIVEEAEEDSTLEGYLAWNDNTGDFIIICNDCTLNKNGEVIE